MKLLDPTRFDNDVSNFVLDYQEEIESLFDAATATNTDNAVSDLCNLLVSFAEYLESE